MTTATADAALKANMDATAHDLETRSLQLSAKYASYFEAIDAGTATEIEDATIALQVAEDQYGAADLRHWGAVMAYHRLGGAMESAAERATH